MGRVLITGAAGSIGRCVATGLHQEGWAVRGFDRASDPELGWDYVQGDITDAAALAAAMADCDAVIHLAAYPHCDGVMLDNLLQPNIIGVWTVLETARAQQLKRVVLASSVNAANGKQTRGRGAVSNDLDAPGNEYGLTKVFAEHAGRFAHHQHGLSVIAIRIGWFPRDAGEVAKIVKHGCENAYLSYDDCLRCFACALRCDDPGFALVYALSKPDPKPSRWDAEPAERLIGFVAQDRWPSGIPADLVAAAEAEIQAEAKPKP
ncbi:MAG: NAD(P)-dependent oxidoreductase [Planctomycetota bacterium]|jgi:nucleoside-diphosphate-sugar epimerase|nr:NAD(P)-dependent oxidoreductase [Planctomycetota bacterium]